VKIVLGFKVRGLILAAAFFVGLGFGTSASARLSYLVDLNSKTVSYLGTLGGSFTEGVRHQRRRAGGGLVLLG
jgi:hypothetical protein